MAHSYHDNRHVKVVKLSALGTVHPYLAGNIPDTHFCYRLSGSRTIVWPEEFCHWKIPTTPPGIAPATFRFVAQCLNQMRHHVICSTGRYSLGAVRYEKLTVAYRSGWSGGNAVYLPRGIFRFRSLLGYRLRSSEVYLVLRNFSTEIRYILLDHRSLLQYTFHLILQKSPTHRLYMHLLYNA
jgi:hypothetical protein